MLVHRRRRCVQGTGARGGRTCREVREDNGAGAGQAIPATTLAHTLSTTWEHSRPSYARVHRSRRWRQAVGDDALNLKPSACPLLLMKRQPEGLSLEAVVVVVVVHRTGNGWLALSRSLCNQTCPSVRSGWRVGGALRAERQGTHAAFRPHSTLVSIRGLPYTAGQYISTGPI